MSQTRYTGQTQVFIALSSSFLDILFLYNNTFCMYTLFPFFFFLLILCPSLLALCGGCKISGSRFSLQRNARFCEPAVRLGLGSARLREVSDASGCGLSRRLVSAYSVTPRERRQVRFLGREQIPTTSCFAVCWISHTPLYFLV